MANTPKKLYAGTPALAPNIVYTVPTSTKTIVKSVVMVNVTAVEATVILNFAGLELISSYKIAPRDTVVIDFSLVLETGETITLQQGTASSINIHISGVEVA